MLLALQGELDLSSGARLAMRLADEGRLGIRVAVDLTELDFIDPAGMGVLQRATLWAGEEGWELSITGPRPNVSRVLRLTNLAAQATRAPRAGASFRRILSLGSSETS